MVTGAELGTSSRLRRHTLSRALIVQTAIELLDEGPDVFSFTRLGNRLGCSPTAVYRHFASRDEIVVAIAEELNRQLSLDYDPHAPWEEAIRTFADGSWDIAGRHPAAVVLSFHVVTGGPLEARGVENLLQTFVRAGWDGNRAVLAYHATVTMVFGLAVVHANRILRGQNAVSAGTSSYDVDLAAHPLIGRFQDDLAMLDSKDTFDRTVQLLIRALAESQ